MISALKNITASDFDAWYAASRHAFLGEGTQASRVADQLILAGHVVGRSILDLGGGAGNFAAAAEAAGARRVVVVDFSIAAIEIAKENTLESELVQADILEYLKSRPGRFDVVTCFDVLEEMTPGLLFQIVPLLEADRFALSIPIAAGSLEVSTHQVIYDVDLDVEPCLKVHGWQREFLLAGSKEHHWARYARI